MRNVVNSELYNRTIVLHNVIYGVVCFLVSDSPERRLLRCLMRAGYTVSMVYGALDATARKINIAKFRVRALSSKRPCFEGIALAATGILSSRTTVNFCFPSPRWV